MAKIIVIGNHDKLDIARILRTKCGEDVVCLSEKEYDNELKRELILSKMIIPDLTASDCEYKRKGKGERKRNSSSYRKKNY